jgi:hypothetical protein
VAGFCEYGDESSGSVATELVLYSIVPQVRNVCVCVRARHVVNNFSSADRMLNILVPSKAKMQTVVCGVSLLRIESSCGLL